MTRTENIELIRSKVIETNPEKEWTTGDTRNYDTPARLADVLLAIGNKYSIQGSGHFMWYGQDDDESIGWNEIWHDGQRRVWNLHRDDLDKQSDETITFIADLLK